jgi:hypothetical protein
MIEAGPGSPIFWIPPVKAWWEDSRWKAGFADCIEQAVDRPQAGLSGSTAEPGREVGPTVSELAERIKGLKAAHCVEATPQRIRQKLLIRVRSWWLICYPTVGHWHIPSTSCPIAWRSRGRKLNDGLSVESSDAGQGESPE